MVGCDRDISDRGIEPDIEDLAFEFLDGDRHTPFKITSDALRLETHVDPSVGDVD